LLEDYVLTNHFKKSKLPTEIQACRRFHLDLEQTAPSERFEMEFDLRAKLIYCLQQILAENLIKNSKS
jgi:hypothetical protein